MSRLGLRLRRTLSAASLGALGVLGCQSIADVPDVSYSAICGEYCAQMFNTCTGPAGQYEDRRTCLEVCTKLDESANGSVADLGNTVQCRLNSLADAARSEGAPSDLLQYCTQAGPGGGKTCTLKTESPDCEGYCALYDAACHGDSKNPFNGAIPDDTTGTQADCIEKCRAIQPMTEPGYTWQTGKNSGDTLGCRLYYVSAAVVDPEANCDFAGIRPAGACRGKGSEPSCPNFCLALTTACAGDLKVYENVEQCTAVCSATEPGNKQSIESVDTIGCRSAHAFNALLVSASDHCPHTGPLGANVCGEGGNCEAYCALARAACPSGYASNYSDDDDCREQCAGLGGAEKGVYSVADAKKGGNTVQCRGLAVSRALAMPEATRGAAACAPVFGGAPCTD